RKDAQLVLRRECAATGTVQKFRRRSSRRWNDRRPPAVLLISAGCCKSLAVFDFGHNHWMFVLCPKGKLPAGVCLIIIGTEGLAVITPPNRGLRVPVGRRRARFEIPLADHARNRSAEPPPRLVLSPHPRSRLSR